MSPPDVLPDADRCVEHLKEALRRGELRPGQRLGEESIARALKMGRAPVRIAFERLVCAGLFLRIHRSGTFVRQLSLPEYRDLMEVRALLESHAARLAAGRAEAPVLEELANLATELEALEEGGLTPEAWSELQRLEVAFHTRIAQISGNEVLCQTLDQQNVIRLCFVERRSPLAPARAEVPHRAVVEAIASRDGERAAQTMRRHILSGLQTLLTRTL